MSSGTVWTVLDKSGSVENQAGSRLTERWLAYGCWLNTLPNCGLGPSACIGYADAYDSKKMEIGTVTELPGCGRRRLRSPLRRSSRFGRRSRSRLGSRSRWWYNLWFGFGLYYAFLGCFLRFLLHGLLDFLLCQDNIHRHNVATLQS